MQSLIPGAYERNTLTYRQPGSMGGAAFGSDDVAAGPSSMSEATILDREMEGGGGVSQRPRRPPVPAAPTAPPPVQSGTAHRGHTPYRRDMRIPWMTTLLIITWLLALIIAGGLGAFGVLGWTLLAVLAVSSVIVVRRVQGGPNATLSESIQAARR
jgi:hypothetical protein